MQPGKLAIILNPQFDVERCDGEGLGKPLVPERAGDAGFLQRVLEPLEFRRARESDYLFQKSCF